MRHQEGGHSYLGGQAFRKEDIPNDLLILKDSPIKGRRTFQGLDYLEGRESKKEDIPNLEDKTPRKEDIPKDLLTLKDKTPRRRTCLTCLSWRTRPKEEDIPGDALILIRYPARTRVHTQRRTHGPQGKKDIRV